MNVVTIEIGQKWREKDKRFPNLPVRTVVGFDARGRVLLTRPNGRTSSCDPKRFNGKTGGYELVEKTDAS